MRNKLLLFIAAVCVAGIVTTGAQAQRQQISPEQRTQRLKDSLALTEEQTASVLTIYQDMDKERKAIFESNSDDRQAAMKSMRDLADKTDGKIEALLTPEQKAKYDEMKKQRQERGGMRRRQESNPPDEKKQE